MKTIIILVIVAVAIAKEYTVENCKCWEGYQAVKREKLDVICEGILLDSWAPCDRPQPPRCQCGEGVNGVLQNRNGTWCSVHKKGKLVRKWPCENKEDWDAYKIELQDYKKSLADD